MRVTGKGAGSPQSLDRSEQSAGDRISLSVRTSMLSEFRNTRGLLRAFEIGREYTTFGSLCAALERMPGVQFTAHTPSSRFRRPARFVFKGHEYEVGLPFGDYRVEPVAPGIAYAEMEELLTFVKRNVLQSRLHRVRAAFLRT